ncbi:hypothetical protein [Streptomyces sp. NPDC001770]
MSRRPASLPAVRRLAAVFPSHEDGAPETARVFGDRDGSGARGRGDGSDGSGDLQGKKT